MRPQFREGLVGAARDFDLETEVIVFDEFDTSPKALDKVKARIEQGDFDLIISSMSPVAIALAGEVAKHPDTHFAYIDADLADLRLEKAPNASAMFLLGGSGSSIAGYLAALMSKSGVISIVGGVPSAAENLVYWFEQGAKRARPDVEVRVDYSKTFVNQALCEKIANRQIDAGSDVVFAAAGECGLGALSATGIRGVWGIGVDRDQSDLGPHILASVVKRFDRGVELTVRQFLEGELPAGKTVNIGMREGVVALVGVNPAVPDGVRKKLARQVALVRKEEAKID
jgi:basic membrane protein A